MQFDWVPGPPWDEVTQSLGLALLCTPLMLMLMRRFERYTCTVMFCTASTAVSCG